MYFSAVGKLLRDGGCGVVVVSRLFSCIFPLLMNGNETATWCGLASLAPCKCHRQFCSAVCLGNEPTPTRNVAWWLREYMSRPSNKLDPHDLWSVNVLWKKYYLPRILSGQVVDGFRCLCDVNEIRVVSCVQRILYEILTYQINKYISLGCKIYTCSGR